MPNRPSRRVALAVIAACAASLAAVAPAAAESFSVKPLDFHVMTGPNGDVPCTITADLYRPDSATKANPAPAILTTNGFGGSKSDQATFGKAYAARGYVVLSYSGLGFGGSGCKITLDDRDYDGKAGSQLVDFLGGAKAADDGTKADYVQRDQTAHDGRHHDADPRVGMIGGSYGGQIQFAIAGIDPRVDTIIPIITWNDLSYSLAPNNTSFSRGVTYETPGVEKAGWTSLFFAAGIMSGLEGASADPSRNAGMCPNFDDRACASKAQMDATGAPNDATIAFARHASVTSFMSNITIPTLLAQGQADTLFNLQESVATYRALKAQGTPVKLIWQSWGHSDGTPQPGELDFAKPDGTYEGRTFMAWFDHYLKGEPAAPSLDFTFFRDWVKYSGDATPAYGRTAGYPAAASEADFGLSGDGTLVSDPKQAKAGSVSFQTPAAGAPSSFSEVPAVDQTSPVTDAPGTTAQFASAPLDRDTDVIGVPSVDLRVSSPLQQGTGQAGAPGELALFLKLYDVAPDGTIDLPHRLVAATRFAMPDIATHVELPGIVHRFAKGHRMVLVVAGGDSGYRGNNVSGPVDVLTDPARPSLLHLPIADEAKIGAPLEAAAPGAGRTCKSRRGLTVHVRKRFRGRVRSAAVYVGGKRLGRLRTGHTSVRIVLKGRPKGTTTVKLVMRLKSGKRVVDTRRYKTCTKRGAR